MGKHDEVRAAYDTHVWGLEKNFAQDQIGAASLLARMELAGIDVEERWTDVADHIAQRGADTTLPFLTMQYLYALGRSDNPMADTLISAVKQKASAPGFDQDVWQNVALPACEAYGLAAATMYLSPATNCLCTTPVAASGSRVSIVLAFCANKGKDKALRVSANKQLSLKFIIT